MLFSKNENKPASSIEEKIKLYRRQGHIVPPPKDYQERGTDKRHP